MRILVLTVLLWASLPVRLCSGQSAASSDEVENGYWWQSKTLPAKVWYVEGFVSGVTQARTTTTAHFSRTHPGRPLSRDELVLLSSIDFTKIRYGQFVEGLDQFYKDYRNTSIHVDDAIFYVRDTLTNTPEGLLKQSLETLQKTSHESWYDQQ